MIGRLTSKVMSDSEPGIQEDIIGSDEEERGTSRQRGQREHRAVLDQLQSQEPEPDQREEEDDKQRMDDGGQPDYRPTALFENPPIRKDLEKLDQAVYYQQKDDFDSGYGSFPAKRFANKPTDDEDGDTTEDDISDVA